MFREVSIRVFQWYQKNDNQQYHSMELVYIYIVSLVVFLFILYFDKGTITVRHFINYFWVGLIPVVNTFFAVGVIVIIIDEYLRERYKLPKLGEKWDNFLNKKLWK